MAGLAGWCWVSRRIGLLSVADGLSRAADGLRTRDPRVITFHDVTPDSYLVEVGTEASSSPATPGVDAVAGEAAQRAVVGVGVDAPEALVGQPGRAGAELVAQ